VRESIKMDLEQKWCEELFELILTLKTVQVQDFVSTVLYLEVP
jgi:hypothetical protein